MTAPIAVFSALRPELDLLVSNLESPSRETLAGRPVWVGDLEGLLAVLVQAGLGKVNTAALAGVVWERYRPRVFVFTGVAGGLDPDLAVGDVVIGELCIQHDAGVVGPDGLERYQAGHIPFFNPTDRFGFGPPEELLTRVRNRLEGFLLEPVMGREPRIVTGTILTGDQFLADETTRDRLFAELGGAAVEMEGAALAQAAEILGVDHLVIRSLSDRAGRDSISDFGQFLSEVAANSARVVRHLLPVL
ncbi:MAG: 5'-methylthioadenosine/S-adenosylhomocysteine nucleosidase [Acidimicrobiia bacterium]